jgi:hypothetical protein
MPVLPPSNSPRMFNNTTTAQAVMDAVSQDLRNQLSSAIGTVDAGILLDYVNRVSLDLLKVSKWWFLLSAPEIFITQSGVTNYWIGAIGANPFGTYDTQLNLTDVRYVKPKSVVDRTNFRPLGSYNEMPLSAKLTYGDASSRPGRPAVWRQDETAVDVLNIYPAPDNQALFQPQPESPICTIVPGGTLPNRIYFVTTTYIDSLGNESTAPYAAEVFVPAGTLLVVTPPTQPLLASATGIRYDRYNVYAASAGTDEKRYIYFNQTTLQASNISVAGTWTEPTTGLISTGVNPPAQNNIEPINGYVIEFRYFRQITPITNAGQILQIPDDYKHVFIAGVNALAFQFLFRSQEASIWEARYQQGIQKIVRDLNFMSKTGDYFGPDPCSVGGFLPALETLDLGLLTP